MKMVKFDRFAHVIKDSFVPSRNASSSCHVLITSFVSLLGCFRVNLVLKEIRKGCWEGSVKRLCKSKKSVQVSCKRLMSSIRLGRALSALTLVLVATTPTSVATITTAAVASTVVATFEAVVSSTAMETTLVST